MNLFPPRSRVLFLTGLLAITPPVFAAAGHDPCPHGACFEREVRRGDTALLLRGFGTKRFWGFTVYDAALYLPADLGDPKKALEPIPKKLVLRYHRDISREDILRAAWHNLENNPDLDLEALRTRVGQLHSKFRDVKTHDRYALLFVPGQGTELLYNGTSEIVIPGDDFQRAYFGIWLSDRPISKKLRRDLFAWREK